MNIKELQNFRLAKAIDFNNDLNPQIFMGDKMRPLVRNKLMNIADHFREFLGVQDIALADIEVSGSNAAYSYTPHSDVDLHLIVDFSELPDSDIYRELFNAKQYQYNDLHIIRIKGYDVELYVQDAAQSHHSLGSYSVMNDDWNRIPTKQRANLDDTATLLKYEKLKALAIRALASDNEKYLIDVLDVVKKYRQAGLDAHGEFGPENLAFKMLRTDGYFDKLWKKRRGHTNQLLSLETENPDALAQEFMEELNAGSTSIQTEGMVKRMANARESLFDDFDYDYVYEAASGLVTLEAAYDGNIGMMELMKFYKEASKDMIAIFNRLVDTDKTTEAWAMVQKFTDTKLVGKEFNEGVGIIVKGVNTTDDVDENSTKREAAKLGLTVTKAGIPPIPKNGVPKLYEGVLTELNMSPGRLQKEVDRILQSAAPRIGLEFEVIMPSDEESNPGISSHTTEDDLREFFSLNSNEDFDHIDEIYFEWLADKQHEWSDERAMETLNNPGDESAKKIEFMVDDYVTSGDADEIIARITGDENDIEITTDMADETIARADQIYKANGPVDEWPQPTSGADPFIRLYYEIFVEDNLEVKGKFNEYYFEDFYSNVAGDIEYSIGAYFRTHHINSMGDVYREFENDLMWPGGPLHQGEFDENYAYQVADEIEQLIGDSVSVEGGDSYGDINTADNWVITSDASIRPDEDAGEDAGLEIITPAMEYEEGIGHITNVFDYLKSKGAYVNSTTGLHINVSLDNIAHSMLNYPKLVVMLGDESIMEKYERMFNEHVESSLNSLSNMMNANVGFPRDRPKKVKMIATMMGKLRGDFNNAVASSFNEKLDFGKFSSVGIKDGWIEFRAAGGADYLDDLDDIINMINRFIVAYIVACDPKAYKNEYGKKLYRLITNIDNSHATPTAMSLFAKFSSGMITKDELISKVNAINAEKEADDGQPESVYDAMHEISKKGRMTLAYVQTAWNAGMDVEMKRFGDSSNAVLQQKRATKEVYKNLMKDVKHYRKAGMPPSFYDAIENIADEHDIEDVEAKEFFHAAMGHELRVRDNNHMASIAVYKNLMNDLRHYNR